MYEGPDEGNGIVPVPAFTSMLVEAVRERGGAPEAAEDLGAYAIGSSSSA